MRRERLSLAVKRRMIIAVTSGSSNSVHYNHSIIQHTHTHIYFSAAHKYVSQIDNKKNHPIPSSAQERKLISLTFSKCTVLSNNSYYDNCGMCIGYSRHSFMNFYSVFRMHLLLLCVLDYNNPKWFSYQLTCITEPLIDSNHLCKDFMNLITPPPTHTHLYIHTPMSINYDMGIPKAPLNQLYT